MDSWGETTIYGWKIWFFFKLQKNGKSIKWWTAERLQALSGGGVCLQLYLKTTEQ